MTNKPPTIRDMYASSTITNCITTFNSLVTSDNHKLKMYKDHFNNVVFSVVENTRRSGKQVFYTENIPAGITPQEKQVCLDRLLDLIEKYR